jgi:hypothetical protein
MKITLAFLLGGAIASAIFAWGVVPTVAKDKYDFGRTTGYIAAQLELVDKIPAALGTDYLKEDGYHPLFEVKTNAIVVVERNGVKTLRSYPQ